MSRHRRQKRTDPGGPEGAIDRGPLVRVVAYVPAKTLAEFDAIADQEQLSRSAAIVDAMGWWWVRHKRWHERRQHVTAHRSARAHAEAEAIARWRAAMRADGE